MKDNDELVCSFRKELESFSFQKQIVFCYCRNDLSVLKIRKKSFKISVIVFEKMLLVRLQSSMQC